MADWVGNKWFQDFCLPQNGYIRQYKWLGRFMNGCKYVEGGPQLPLTGVNRTMSTRVRGVRQGASQSLATIALSLSNSTIATGGSTCSTLKCKGLTWTTHRGGCSMQEIVETQKRCKRSNRFNLCLLTGAWLIILSLLCNQSSGCTLHTFLLQSNFNIHPFCCQPLNKDKEWEWFKKNNLVTYLQEGVDMAATQFSS